MCWGYTKCIINVGNDSIVSFPEFKHLKRLPVLEKMRITMQLKIGQLISLPGVFKRLSKLYLKKNAHLLKIGQLKTSSGVFKVSVIASFDRTGIR